MRKKKTEQKAEEPQVVLGDRAEEPVNPVIDETALLKGRIAELEDQLAKAKNDYFKAYAETENTRKRLRAEFESHNKYRLQNFAGEILPALDNLEKALASTEEGSPLQVGVRMIYDQLKSSLAKEGVSEIEALHRDFDPNVHQAIATEKLEGVKPGQVVEVYQKGYKLKDRVLRASMVKVSE